MKAQTLALIEVGTYLVIGSLAALLQGSVVVAQYSPPTQGAGSGSPTGQTVNTGSRMIDTTVNACGTCTTDAGTKGDYSDQTDPKRCVQCDGRVE